MKNNAESAGSRDLRPAREEQEDSMYDHEGQTAKSTAPIVLSSTASGSDGGGVWSGE